MTLKLKRTPGLYLVGFMGCGKTTVGRALAEEIGWCFIDIDADIEAQERKTISEIFGERTEAGFRDLETQMIRSRVARIECGMPCVVALGGGAFVQPGNWDLIENNGVTVWLDCSLETVRAHLSGTTHRPLALNGNHLAQLFEDRRRSYARADFRVDADCPDASSTVRKILQLPIF